MPVAVIAIIAIVTVIVIAVLGARRFAQERIERDVRERLEQSSSLAAVAAAENVDRMAVIVDAVARLPRLADTLEERDPEAVDGLARTLQQATRGALVGGVVSPDARLLGVYPNDDDAMRRSYRDRDWYRGVQRRSPYVSEAYTANFADKPRVVTIAAAVQQPGDDVAGYVIVGIRTDYFGRALERASEAAGAPDLRIVDQDDDVVASSGGFGADDQLVDSTAIRGTGWRLEASLDEDDAYADLHDFRVAASTFMFVVCSLLLVLAGVLWGNSRRLASARREEERRAQAFELNDTIVQRLAVAHMALSLGRPAEALEALDAALDAGRRIIGELASGRDDYVRAHAAGRPEQLPAEERPIP